MFNRGQNERDTHTQKEEFSLLSSFETKNCFDGSIVSSDMSIKIGNEEKTERINEDKSTFISYLSD